MNRPEYKDQVVIFDAFREDFLDDPLIAFVAELSEDAEQKPKAESAKFMGDLKQAAVPLARGATRVGFSVVSGGLSEGGAAAGRP